MRHTADLLICDIHLDTKGCRGKQLYKLLKRLRHEKSLRIERVINLGDFFQKTPHPTDRTFFERLEKKHPYQANLFYLLRRWHDEDGVDIIHIPGNHDPDIAMVQASFPDMIAGRVVGEDEGYLWERGGVKHFAIHAHQGDPAIKKYGEGKLLKWALRGRAALEYFEGENPKFIRFLQKKLTNKSWKQATEGSPLYAMMMAERHGARHAYWAHTHDPILNRPFGNVLGHCPGSFAEETPSYILVTDEGPQLHMIE